MGRQTNLFRPLVLPLATVQNLYLEEDDTNQKILSDIKEKLENGMIVRKAVQRVLARHGTKFDDKFQYQDEDEDDNEEEMEGTEESDN